MTSKAGCSDPQAAGHSPKATPQLYAPCALVQHVIYERNRPVLKPNSLPSSTMNVSFTSSGLTNSTVVDSATGKTLFEVSTPFSIHYNTTLRDAQNNVVGEFKQGMVHDEVTYQGRTMRVSEWLPKKSILSRYAAFCSVVQ